MDAWFSEAYWKIASLYLDREDWKNAAFEIARFLSVHSSDASAEAMTQIYGYFAESTDHVGRKDLARWAAERSLRWNPSNTGAIASNRRRLRSPCSAISRSVGTSRRNRRSASLGAGAR